VRKGENEMKNDKWEFEQKVFQIKNRVIGLGLVANAAGVNHGIIMIDELDNKDTMVEKQREAEWETEQKKYEAEIDTLLDELTKLYDEKGKE
jgi:hypothetical protein